MVNWKNPLFINTFTSLPGAFFSALPACPCADNYLIAVHAAAAQLPDLKIDDASLDADQLSGKDLLSACMPLAIAYADHQFGSYIPELGDGYELLLGDARNTYGNLWELQLKGAGPTPYSRMDEGRAVLRSSIREVLGYKAMSGLADHSRAVRHGQRHCGVPRTCRDHYDATTPGAVACAFRLI